MVVVALEVDSPKPFYSGYHVLLVVVALEVALVVDFPFYSDFHVSYIFQQLKIVPNEFLKNIRIIAQIDPETHFLNVSACHNTGFIESKCKRYN